MRLTRVSPLFLLLCVLVYSPAQAAWDFVPTASEWEAWPPYCRAQYGWVNHDFEFDFAAKVPPDAIERWREAVGADTFIHLHHWCASIHFLNRARVEPDPQKRNFMLERAWADGMYTFSRADPQCIVYPVMSVTVAQIRLEMGKPDEAEQLLQRSMQAQPKRPEPYVMLALLRRKQHKLAESRDILRQADVAAEGKSAEIQYNLGLINVELGDLDSAVANAERAYSRGYPLPGLKEKLRKAGRWGAAEERAAAAPVAAAGDPAGALKQ